MAAVGWLVAALLVTIGIACGLGWLVASERRLHRDTREGAILATERAVSAERRLEARDAELASLRLALILAQQEVRESAERTRIAAATDSQVAADLAAALAARRLPRYGRDGAGGLASLATCDTAPDLGGLAARTSASVPAGAALPGGVGGPGGARGLGPR